MDVLPTAYDSYTPNVAKLTVTTTITVSVGWK